MFPFKVYATVTETILRDQSQLVAGFATESAARTFAECQANQDRRAGSPIRPTYLVIHQGRPIHRTGPDPVQSALEF